MPVPPLRPTAIAVYVYREIFPDHFEFLQIQRSEKARGHHHLWQTVYGSIEEGETAVAAAMRELSEETHLTPVRMFQVEFIESFYFRPNDALLHMPVFAAQVAPNAEIILNAEHTAHRWVAEPQIAGHFMWRTQRDALRIILETLRNPGPALDYLTILPKA